MIRIRHPETRLLLASLDPIAWTDRREKSLSFSTRAAAEAARDYLRAQVRRPPPQRNIFVDANVILRRSPYLAVQILTERGALPLSQAAVYVHARRKDWDAGRLA